MVTPTEGPLEHLRNAWQLVTAYKGILSGLPTTADGRFTPEEPEAIGDMLGAVCTRCNAAYLAFLRDQEGRAYGVPRILTIETLRACWSEAAYAAKSWETVRGHYGGPKLGAVLGLLSALSRRLEEAVSSLEALQSAYGKFRTGSGRPEGGL